MIDVACRDKVNKKFMKEFKVIICTVRLPCINKIHDKKEIALRIKELK